ncbi:MAG: hypothetical protein JXN63_05690 [Candidatus Delongbacteria bacterium]|nr:hypothetical protein [Candidatus Delongbacteria bacterium]
MARFLSVILFLLVTVSCSDIFSTRDPENPDGNNEGVYNETAEDLVISFKTSLLTLDLYRYESLFLNLPDHEDSYTFISQASDVEQSRFYEWNIENEKYFITGIKNDSIGFSEIELSYDIPGETSESVELNVDYRMNVTKGETSYEIKGTFIFDLIKINSLFWYIRTWTDVSSSGNKSFSSLKEPYAY